MKNLRINPILVLIVVAALIFFVPVSKNPYSFFHKNNQYPTPTIVSSRYLFTQSLNKKSFQKKLFDPVEKFGSVTKNGDNIYYEGISPKEILDIYDANLDGLRCISFNKSDSLNKDWWSQIKDKEISAIAQKITNLAPQGQRYALEFLCETENNKKFITYSQLSSEYSNWQNINILKYKIANIDGVNIDEVATIYEAKATYPRCEGPLELTKAGELYIECGSGDTAYHYKIYKVNLNSKIQSVPLSCYGCSTRTGCAYPIPTQVPSASIADSVVNICKKGNFNL